MKSSILFGIIFFALIFFSLNVSACSCAPQVSINEALENSDAVFLGTANVITTLEACQFGFCNSKTIFSVQKSWKGVDSGTVELVSAFGGTGSCDFTFSDGKDFLVFANFTNEGSVYSGALITSICTRTKLVQSSLDSDVVSLGKPERDFSNLTDASLDVVNSVVAVLVLGVLLVGVLGIAVGVKKFLHK